MNIDTLAPPEEITVGLQTYRRPPESITGMVVQMARTLAESYRQKGAPVELREFGGAWYVYVCTCWL